MKAKIIKSRVLVWFISLLLVACRSISFTDRQSSSSVAKHTSAYDVSSQLNSYSVSDSSFSDYRFGKLMSMGSDTVYRVDTIIKDRVKTKVMVRLVRDTSIVVRKDTITQERYKYVKENTYLCTMQDLFGFLVGVLIFALLIYQYGRKIRG